ncbi:Detected protein of unknown function [Hibiscus syriacus]|uniref:Spt6 SH2 domain-containing protein n=1 Tax=Hibiscus syriacus TaxID=106335 RepID=A0A6A2XMD8_HIBSY|nr:Detected protein of unknown function [Hibiscus syriacus]
MLADHMGMHMGVLGSLMVQPCAWDEAWSCASPLDDEILTDEEKGMACLAREYFKDLFGLSSSQIDDSILEEIDIRITSEMNSVLSHPFSKEEMEIAMKSLCLRKALGEDGLGALFYQPFRHLIGKDVADYCIAIVEELELKGARHMAALELSCEPYIKKHIRSIFRDKAVVSTNPTPQGNVEIDCFYQFSSIKWIHDKPLSEFNDAQWLLIQKAEEEELLQLWKEQYKLILHDAFFNFLLPSMEKEARNLLTTRAKHGLLRECGKELWKPATTFVMLDSSGVLLDTLEARSFSLQPQTIDDQQRKKYDWQSVLKLMKTHQPHVIVIGATNAYCVRLKDDVKEIISKLEERHRDLGQATNGISVVFGDESLPQLYEQSPISTDQFPEQQFVSGLGPRKASILQREAAQYRAVNSRKELASFGLKTEKVFHNAVERLAKAACNNITEAPVEYVKKEPQDDIADESGDCSLQNKLHEGDNVLCKIKQIDKMKCRGNSDLQRRWESSPKPAAEKLRRSLEKKHFIPQTITRPCFRNMTMDEAMEFLSDKAAGESIFRLSSRGTSFLTLTLKVFNELHVNKDISESGKDHNDIISLLQLGKTLKIGDKAFGNLDEVMDRYFVPLVKHLKEMLGFQKFKSGSKAEVDEALRVEKAEYPLRIVYCFGVSFEHPDSGSEHLRRLNISRDIFRKTLMLCSRSQPHLKVRKPGIPQDHASGDGKQGQFNYREVRAASKGSNHRDGKGDEDEGKMNSSGIPRPRNVPVRVSSGVATKCGDIDSAPNNEDLAYTKSSDSLDNAGVWHASKNNAPCGFEGRDGGRGSSNWGGNKQGQSSGGRFGTNEGGWQASRNNIGGVVGYMSMIIVLEMPGVTAIVGVATMRIKVAVTALIAREI